jgi:hypothetical protein
MKVTALLHVSKDRSSEVARQSVVGRTPLLPAIHQERVVKFHNGMSILSACMGKRLPLFFSSHDCSVFESSRGNGIRPRTVGGLTSLYNLPLIRSLVKR